MKESRGCINGCCLRGRHLPGCGEDACSGCLPRLAEFGCLCPWCWQRLHAVVVDLPGLLAHLVEMAEPSLSSALGKPQGPRAPASSGCLYHPALAAADELTALLASWCLEVVRLHPAELRGPSQLGWRYTHPRARRDISEEWVFPDPSVISTDAQAAAGMVRWILPLLDWVASQPWVVDLLTELHSAESTALLRWPREERVRPVDLACPACDRRSLRYYPPAFEGAVVQVSCSHPDCGLIMTEAEWLTQAKAALEALPGEVGGDSDGEVA